MCSGCNGFVFRIRNFRFMVDRFRPQDSQARVYRCASVQHSSTKRRATIQTLNPTVLLTDTEMHLLVVPRQIVGISVYSYLSGICQGFALHLTTRP